MMVAVLSTVEPPARACLVSPSAFGSVKTVVPSIISVASWLGETPNQFVIEFRNHLASACENKNMRVKNKKRVRICVRNAYLYTYIFN